MKLLRLIFPRFWLARRKFVNQRVYEWTYVTKKDFVHSCHCTVRWSDGRSNLEEDWFCNSEERQLARSVFDQGFWQARRLMLQGRGTMWWSRRIELETVLDRIREETKENRAFIKLADEHLAESLLARAAIDRHDWEAYERHHARMLELTKQMIASIEEKKRLRDSLLEA